MKMEVAVMEIFPIRRSYLEAQNNRAAIIAVMHVLGTLGNAVELICLWLQGSEQDQLLGCRASTF